jgi:hypothetical protein
VKLLRRDKVLWLFRQPLLHFLQTNTITAGSHFVGNCFRGIMGLKTNFGTDTKTFEVPFIIKPRISSSLTDLVGLGLLKTFRKSRSLRTKMILAAHQQTKPKGKKRLQNKRQEMWMQFFYYKYYYYYTVVVVFVVVAAVSFHRSFLPGTSELTVISTAQAVSFRLQYFPYYLLCFNYSCHLL